MKKLLFGTMLLALVIVVAIPTMAQVNIRISFPLPPPIVFEAPPQVVVLPEADDVYVDPDIDVDLYFWNGWWWRFWEGRWYRSLYYDRDWVYYDYIPGFYFSVDPDWRIFYRDHNWHGHNWRYDRIPYRELRQNWRGWHNDRYWQRHESWGVRNYQPQPKQQMQQQRQQRQQQYQQRPEVQQHQKQVQQPKQVEKQQPQEKVQQPQRQPQVQQPKQQPQERVEQPQRKEQKPQGQQRQGESQHPQSQGKPEGGEVEHKK